MPVDSDGNVADIVMDGNSTINRMNIARLYEQYFKAASRDVQKNLRLITGITKEERHHHIKVQELYSKNNAKFHEAYNYLMGYYQIMSPLQYNRFNNELSDEDKVSHLSYVLKEFVYLFLTTDNPPLLVDMYKQVEAKYKPLYGPVSYIGYSGNRVTTHSNVRIGSIYIMLLEKTGDDWSSVSSGKLHHFGFLAPVNRADRHSQPLRNQPVRAFGESETRILVSYCGQRATAEIMDRNGSPETHKEIVNSILVANHPTNIDIAVDRKVVPLGNSKPMQIVNHIGFCAGWKFVYAPAKKVITG